MTDGDKALEREAISLVRQYGFALTMVRPLKELLMKIAVRLEWHNLQKEL